MISWRPLTYKTFSPRGRVRLYSFFVKQIPLKHDWHLVAIRDGRGPWRRPPYYNPKIGSR